MVNPATDTSARFPRLISRPTEVPMTVAFWRTLYTPGHDVARLIPADDGWRLSGTALCFY